MRLAGERRPVVCLQEESASCADELVRPGRQAERAEFSILLGDEHAEGRGEPVPLAAHHLGDGVYLRFVHAVRGLAGDSGRHRARISVDVAVGQQVKILVPQLPVEFVTRQLSFAAFAEYTQHPLAALHFACLLILVMSAACAPSPCRPRYRSAPERASPSDYYRHPVTVREIPLPSIVLPSLRCSHNSLVPYLSSAP